MGRITATPELAALLRQLREVTEICDDRDAVIGVYTPQPPAGTSPQEDLFDLEEAERILAEEGHLGRPLSEFRDEIFRPRTSG